MLLGTTSLSRFENEISQRRKESYVGTAAKEHLWRKLMVNFTLPAPEVDPEEEEPNEEEMKRRKEAIEKKSQGVGS